MTPVQEGVGEQTEHTSIATRAVNPRWVRCTSKMPPEYQELCLLGSADGNIINSTFLKASIDPRGARDVV